MKYGVTRMKKENAVFDNAEAAWVDMQSRMPEGMADNVNNIIAQLQTSGIVTDYTRSWDPLKFTLTITRNISDYDALTATFFNNGINLDDLLGYYELAGWEGTEWSITNV